MFLLIHEYDYGTENEHSETKTLGIYSSEEKAQAAIEYYCSLEGFKLFKKSCFNAIEMKLDENSFWETGFISWQESFDSMLL